MAFHLEGMLPSPPKGTALISLPLILCGRLKELGMHFTLSGHQFGPNLGMPFNLPVPAKLVNLTWVNWTAKAMERLVMKLTTLERRLLY